MPPMQSRTFQHRQRVDFVYMTVDCHFLQSSPSHSPTLILHSFLHARQLLGTRSCQRRPFIWLPQCCLLDSEASSPQCGRSWTRMLLLWPKKYTQSCSAGRSQTARKQLAPFIMQSNISERNEEILVLCLGYHSSMWGSRESPDNIQCF